MAVEIEQQQCPHCGAKIDHGTAMAEGEFVPAAGDFCICIYCERLCLWDADLKLRKASRSDFADAPPHIQRQLVMTSVVMGQVKRRN